MIPFLSTILKWFTGSTLDRVLKTVDNRVNSETERERIKTKAVESYLAAQVATLNGRGWWFPLFFIIPAGLWFSSVCVYSILWCRNCAYPQDWTIAALPAPLDSWMGAIVTSLFIGKAGGELLSRLRK